MNIATAGTLDAITRTAASQGWTYDGFADDLHTFTRGGVRLRVRMSARNVIVMGSLTGERFGEFGVSLGYVGSRDTGKRATVLGWLEADHLGYPRPGIDVAADNRPAVDPFTDTAPSAGYPAPTHECTYCAYYADGTGGSGEAGHYYGTAAEVERHADVHPIGDPADCVTPVDHSDTERAEHAPGCNCATCYARITAEVKAADGEMACCSSSIGPVCEHRRGRHARRRVSLIKPYLTHTARAEALADLEAWDAISERPDAYRWNMDTRTHERVSVHEINGALDGSRGLGERASAVERANFHVLRANFPTLVSADYWLEIGPRTEVSDDLVTALRLMINGEVLDDERLEIERDDILRSAWDAFGWRALRDAAEAALNELLDDARHGITDRAVAALDRLLEAAQDYDTIADLGIDASEADGGTADFTHTDDVADTLAGRALAEVAAAAR